MSGRDAMLTVVLVTLWVFSKSAASNLDRDQYILGFIPKFFEHKSINTLTVLGCYDLNFRVKLLLECSRQSIFLSFDIRSVNTTPARRTGAFLDLTCPDAPQNIDYLSKRWLFNINKEWLVLGEEAGLLGEAYLLPGSSVTLARPPAFTLHQVYRLSLASPPVLRFLTEPSSDLSALAVWRWANKTDLEGSLLKTTTVILFAEAYKGWDKNYLVKLSEIDIWPRIHYQVLNLLSDQLNFRYEVDVVNDYGWEVNGSFGGLMGLLQRREIDMAATGLFLRPDRMEVIDYTVETFELRSVVILRQPLMSSVANIFTLVFTTRVWQACTVMATLSLLLLLVSLGLSSLAPGLRLYSNVPSPADIVSLLVAIICQQGWHQNPVSCSARLAIFVLSLSSLFLYTSYAASIVALLQTPSYVLHSVQDLTHSPLDLRIQNINYNRIFFEESTDADIVELHNTKILPHLDKVYCSPPEGIKFVRSGLYAFLVEVNLAYRLISETFEEGEKCGLSEIQIFFTPKLSMAVVKHSGYREIIAQKLSWQKEIGLLDRLGAQWLAKKPSCGAGHGSYRIVGLKDFRFALLLLAYAFPIALLLLVLETSIYHRKAVFYMLKCNIRKIYTKIKRC